MFLLTFRSWVISKKASPNKVTFLGESLVNFTGYVKVLPEFKWTLEPSESTMLNCFPLGILSVLYDIFVPSAS